MSKNISDRGPIQKRIILITLVGIIFVCLLIGAISYYIFRNYLQDAMISTTQTGLKNLGESIDSSVENVYRMARYCQGSSAISDYIEASPEPGSVLSVATYDRLYEEYKNNEANSYIPRVVVIAGNHYLQACQTTYSTTTDLAKAVTELDFFETLAGADNYDYSTGIINDPFLTRTPRPVVPIIRPITYKFNSDRIGYLYLEFSQDLILKQFNHYYMEDGSRLYLIMCDHIYSYENGVLKEEEKDTRLSEDIPGSGKEVTVDRIDVGYGRETFVCVPLLMKDCYLIQSISPQTLRTHQLPFLLMLIAILASVIAIGITMTMSLDHYIHKPLASIRKKIQNTSEGDFTRDPSIEWNHELGEIGRGINDLSESVNNLLEARLKDEKQKRDLEYQMLQSQINPHFIYNTLNSIKMMASIQGATGISEMTTALASLLRSISKGTSILVPIREELSLIKDYFTIQNYRYGGTISFKVNVADPSIEDSKIIKFTLQPLVENAIFHGLEPKGGTGNIEINLFYTDTDTGAVKARKNICIEVKDDGVGMSPEKIKDIMAGASVGKADFFKEIGINNVHNRIKYEFGEGYGISIESEPGQYTIMRVLIPQRLTNEE